MKSIFKFPHLSLFTNPIMYQLITKFYLNQMKRYISMLMETNFHVIKIKWILSIYVKLYSLNKLLQHAYALKSIPQYKYM